MRFARNIKTGINQWAMHSNLSVSKPESIAMSLIKLNCTSSWSESLAYQCRRVCEIIDKCAVALERENSNTGISVNHPHNSLPRASVYKPAASLNAIVQFYDSSEESENHKEAEIWKISFYWLPIRMFHLICLRRLLSLTLSKSSRTTGRCLIARSLVDAAICDLIIKFCGRMAVGIEMKRPSWVDKKETHKTEFHFPIKLPSIQAWKSSQSLFFINNLPLTLVQTRRMKSHLRSFDSDAPSN